MAQIHRMNFHPAMWWIWAVLTSLTVLISNHALVSCAATLACFAIVRRTKDSRSTHSAFLWAIRFAAIAFSIRMGIGVLLGVPMPGRVVFTLPQLSLPEFMVGIRVGGPVTLQRLENTFSEAMLLVALILIFASANALSNPHALLRILPKRFYGVGLAGVIATSVAPQTVKSIARVKNAKYLRGQSSKGVRSWRGVAMPVLEDALERSIDLAASLESRGYGLNTKPTRYRPERWKIADLLAISGPIYLLLIIFMNPGISILWFAILVLGGALTPMVAQ